MSITFQLPEDVERRLRDRYADLDDQAKESLLVDLYRRRELNHVALSKALGLDRFETEEVLYKHNMIDDLGTVEEHLAEVDAVERLRKKGR